MAEKDIFAPTVQTAAGEFPAYPQHVYEETKEKWPDGSPKMKLLGIAKNPEHHKELLGNTKEPAWGKK